MKRLFTLVIALVTGIFFQTISFSNSTALGFTPKIGGLCLKLNETRNILGQKAICVARKNKLVWIYATPILMSKNVAVTPTTQNSSTNTPITNSSQNNVVDDQSSVFKLNATEGCANPSVTKFFIELQNGSTWTPIPTIDSGWENRASDLCANIANQGKTSLAWIKVKLDHDVTYRWVFEGVVNIELRDEQGRGVSHNLEFKLPEPLVKPLPVANSYGLTWSNVSDRYADVSAAAYVDAQATIKHYLGKNTTAKKFVSYISPGALQTDPNIGNTIPLLKKVFDLWNSFPSSKHIYFVASTQEEFSDTTSKINNLVYYPELITRSFKSMYGIDTNEPAGSVFTVPKCAGNDPARNTVDERNPADGSAITISICPDLSGNSSMQGIHGMLHEYTHTIQTLLYPSWTQSRLQPCWLQEGEPEWTQVAVSDDFDTYLKMQNYHPYYLTMSGIDYIENKQYTWTQADVIKALDQLNDPVACRGPHANYFALSYSLGAAGVEALVAIGGSESVFSLDQRLGRGISWYQAFKDIYGISWKDAEPTLADVIAKKITLSFANNALTYQTRPN